MFNRLPVEAQQQVADFIATLRARHRRSARGARGRTNWEAEPFVGMWRGRQDLEDSSAWVRAVRRGEWAEPHG